VKTRVWKTVRDARLAPAAVARVGSRARARIEALSLQELRQRLEQTQAKMAEATEMTQSELSRFESRADHRVSTLRRYVAALGGELEVNAVFGDQRIRLTKV
jgi:predicted transcriptional regulator